MKTCNKCKVELVVGDNWAESHKKFKQYKCKSCYNKTTRKWQIHNAERNKQHVNKLSFTFKSGIYEILYKGKRVYVGQSNKPYIRISNHFSKFSDLDAAKLKSPIAYKLSTGEIKRKDLSFNMLEYIDDKDTRETVEQQYITASTGLWNKVD